MQLQETANLVHILSQLQEDGPNSNMDGHGLLKTIETDPPNINPKPHPLKHLNHPKILLIPLINGITATQSLTLVANPQLVVVDKQLVEVMRAELLLIAQQVGVIGIDEGSVEDD